jgi:hypothetical protein
MLHFSFVYPPYFSNSLNHIKTHMAIINVKSVYR